LKLRDPSLNCGIEKEKNMEIKVLGPGCAKCLQTEDLVKEAIAESEVDAQVEKVTDIREIAKHGVLTTPAVVIEGQIKCVGKVPDKDEILSWLRL
jgi:small redox-active disulfide protein 2